MQLQSRGVGGVSGWVVEARWLFVPSASDVNSLCSYRCCALKNASGPLESRQGARAGPGLLKEPVGSHVVGGIGAS